MGKKTAIDEVRQALKDAPGTQEFKARGLDTSVSWLQKFLDGRIKNPRADRYEAVRRYLGNSERRAA
jgi:hypothetical protein